MNALIITGIEHISCLDFLQHYPECHHWKGELHHKTLEKNGGSDIYPQNINPSLSLPSGESNCNSTHCSVCFISIFISGLAITVLLSWVAYLFKGNLER